jgi:zinc protease
MSKTPWLFGVAALALVTGAARAADEPHATTPSAPPPPASVPGTIERFTLKNGLRVVLCSDPQAAAADVAVWYDAGTRREKAGRTGVAHLFEHLMFRGSAHAAAGEHARRIEAAGGMFGAFTTADHACYYETVPAPALDLALELEADRMTGLLIDQNRLDATREGIRFERQQPTFTSPPVLGLQKLFAVAFPDHPYRAPLFGVEADLAKLTVADCRTWYKERFGPGRALLTVTGRFDPAAARATIEQRFGGLRSSSGGAVETAKLDFTAPGQRVTAKSRQPFRTLWVGWTLPGRTDPDLVPLALLGAALAHGQNSRLDRALVQVQEPRAVYVEGDVETRDDASLLFCMLAVAPNADSATVERELKTETEKIALESISEDELTHARNRLASELLFSWQTARGRALALGAAIAAGGSEQDAKTQLDRIRACSTADIRRVAERYVTTARRTTLWLLPDHAPAGGAR